MKCNLCRVVLKVEETNFLSYNEGDVFCSSCFSKILGRRKCIYCDDYFYYSNEIKRFCSRTCNCKFNNLKSKVFNGYFSSFSVEELEVYNKNKEVLDEWVKNKKNLLK